MLDAREGRKRVADMPLDRPRPHLSLWRQALCPIEGDAATTKARLQVARSTYVRRRTYARSYCPTLLQRTARGGQQPRRPPLQKT